MREAGIQPRMRVMIRAKTKRVAGTPLSKKKGIFR
jgi:hypothetical protein